MELKDFEVKIGSYTFAHPIMNAAGHAKRQEHFDALLRSESSGIVIGSILPVEEVRMGNSGNVYYPGAKFGKPFSLNSLGIPCQSISYYRERLPMWVRQAEDAGKHLILNIAGFKANDYTTLVRLARDCGVKIIEINFGCPNLVDGGEQKPIFSYDIDAMQRILVHITFLVGVDTEFWIKLSWLEPYQLKRTAAMLFGFPRVKAVVGPNTLANCMEFDDLGRAVITPNKGRGGMSGRAMRPAGYGQVNMWREELDEVRSDVSVIGGSGIYTGNHVWKYVNCAGACATQIGTAYFDACEAHPGSGEKIFSTVLQQYHDTLVEKNQAKART